MLVVPDIFHHFRRVGIRLPLSCPRGSRIAGLLERFPLVNGFVCESRVGFLDLWIVRIVFGFFVVVRNSLCKGLVNRHSLTVWVIGQSDAFNVLLRDVPNILVGRSYGLCIRGPSGCSHPLQNRIFLGRFEGRFVSLRGKAEAGFFCR